jgi:Tfp pilus assembly protein PilO
MRLRIMILPLAIIVSAAVAILYVKPSFSGMQEAKNSLATKQSQLEEIQSQSQKIQQMKTDWENLGEDKTRVEMALPEGESADFYVSELTSKASRSGVLLSDIKFGGSGGSTAENLPYACGANNDAAAPSGAVQSVASAAPAGAPSAAVVSGQSDLTVPAVPPSCLETIDLSLTAKGSWEQLLDFFKYLEDMNRLSNLQAVSISTEAQTQDQVVSDILSLNISTKIFYKKKNPSAITSMASGLVGQAGLNKKAIENLKQVIFSVYSAPQVPPGGQRNLFK